MTGRFAILIHDWPQLHWDLLIERADHLQTWRFNSEPKLGVPIDAQEIQPHRMIYLDYEGPVSGNRGSVVAWDRGTYEESPIDGTFTLQGCRLKGRLSLQVDSGRLVALISKVD